MTYLYIFTLLLTYLNFTNIINYDAYLNFAGYICETYVNGNSTYTYHNISTSTMPVGTITQQIGNSGFVNLTHTPLVKIKFPSFTSVIDSTLELYFQSSNFSVVSISQYSYLPADNSNIVPSIVTNVGIFNVVNNKVTIDLTNLVYSRLNNSYNDLIIGVSRSYSGSYGDLYNFNENNLSISPLLSIHGNTPTITGVGNAPIYTPITFTYSSNIIHFNCHSYAMNSFIGLCDDYNYYPTHPTFYCPNETIYNEAITVNQVIPDMKRASFDYCGGILRDIDDYDSPIYENEYRIAFRIRIIYRPSLDNYVFYSYHFIRQDSDGCWSGKYIENASAKYASTFNPNLDAWKSGDVFAEIHYFAFSKK